MKVTKEQKIYGCVMGVAALALGVDHFFLGADSTGPAEAAASLTVVTAPADPASTSGQVAGQRVAMVSVAEQLQAMDSGAGLGDGEIKDAFKPWATLSEAKAPATQPSVTDNEALKDFRNAHHLTGVMTTGHQAVAIIDGNVLAVGQAVAGFKVTAVGTRAVTLASPEGASVTLPLEERTSARRPAITP